MNTSACQLFASLGRKISTTGGDREGDFLFCREFRCWCSATTLYCYTTPCQPLTARTDDLYPFVYYLNFKTPSETYLPRLKNTNNNSSNTEFSAMMPLGGYRGTALVVKRGWRTLRKVIV